MRLLAVGDIHLGVRPSRLPEELQELARSLGPAEAWRRTVEVAVERHVDAVLLAGDVVDRDDDFFEAIGNFSGESVDSAMPGSRSWPWPAITMSRFCRVWRVRSPASDSSVSRGGGSPTVWDRAAMP
jgi:hypothetical protein